MYISSSSGLPRIEREEGERPARVRAGFYTRQNSAGRRGVGLGVQEGRGGVGIRARA